MPPSFLRLNLTIGFGKAVCLASWHDTCMSLIEERIVARKTVRS